MTILKNYYYSGHIWSQSKRVLKANPKYYNDDFFISYISGALHTMCPLQVRTLASCDRDGDDTLLNAWIVWFKCFNISCSPFVYAYTKSA